jgi:hypothetical protein
MAEVGHGSSRVAPEASFAGGHGKRKRPECAATRGALAKRQPRLAKRSRTGKPDALTVSVRTRPWLELIRRALISA